MPAHLSTKMWAFAFYHANKDAAEEEEHTLAWARQNWYMHALAQHNVKEFSKKLMQEPAQHRPEDEAQRDADEQFVLFDPWLAQIPETPPDWVIDAYLNNSLAPVPQIDAPRDDDEHEPA